jgi:hypothetical protein
MYTTNNIKKYESTADSEPLLKAENTKRIEIIKIKTLLNKFLSIRVIITDELAAKNIILEKEKGVDRGDQIEFGKKFLSNLSKPVSVLLIPSIDRNIKVNPIIITLPSNILKRLIDDV